MFAPHAIQGLPRRGTYIRQTVLNVILWETQEGAISWTFMQGLILAAVNATPTAPAVVRPLKYPNPTSTTV